MNLKAILKSLKLNESTISMVLGGLVIIIVGVLVVSYFKDKGKGSLPSVTTEREISTETPAPKTHKVVKGENLWKIALAQYGSGYNWIDIAQENKLKNANFIAVGQVLTLPDVPIRKPVLTQKPVVQPVKPLVTVKKTVGEPISGGTYTVIRGDNLWNIAVRAYGDGFKWTQISKENKLKNPRLIHAGNILILPR